MMKVRRRRVEVFRVTALCLVRWCLCVEREVRDGLGEQFGDVSAYEQFLREIAANVLTLLGLGPTDTLRHG